MTNNNMNILFCGTGGQGVLKAAEVCGWAAIIDGHHAKKSEVHGMAQRGGSVESHVRYGAEVFSPIIPKGEADILVSFHQGEHDRMLPFLKAGGIDLVGSLRAAETGLKDRRFLNTYLLGVLSKHLSLKEESWLKALEIAFASKPKLLDTNKEIFLNARAAA
jgi:indolepyruvate ferredoxin oxidoreductase beta subunit